MRIDTRSSLVLGVCLAALCASQADAQGAQTATPEAAPASDATQNGAPAPDAPTDSGASAGLQDIIVTAQRHATNVQTTALAVTALTGDNLGARQITSVGALTSAIPNVNFGQSTGNARIAIRGVSFDQVTVGSEARVAYHLDDVYLSRSASALATFFDVDRVEVVRGPQGTLYGRNATAGAVNVITRNPTPTPSGYLGVEIGNYDEHRIEGAVAGPLISGVSGRIAIQTMDHAGYGRNINTGGQVDDQHSLALRGKLDFDLGANSDILVSADYSREKDHAFGFHYFGPGSPYFTPTGFANGGTYPTNPRDEANYPGPDNYRKFYGGSIKARTRIAGVEVTSITGYRSSHYDLITDATNAGIPLTPGYRQIENSDQISEELRIGQGDRPWGNWLIGGYYFHEKVSGDTQFPVAALLYGLPGTSLLQGYFAGGTITTNAYAGFGQVTYRITPKLSLVAGGRYSVETKDDFDLLQNDQTRPYAPSNPLLPLKSQTSSHTWSSFTPKVSLEYEPADNIFAYVTYSQGFKSGGYNLGGVQAPFAPEKLIDYEGGVKAQWFDRRLRTNIAVFHYDYGNLQVSQVVGPTVLVVNAAKATIKGIEAEITAVPVRNLQLEVNVGLLDGRYNQFQTKDAARLVLGVLNLAGNHLTQSPNYTIDLAAQYKLQVSSGDITLRAESRLVDRVFFTPFNTSYADQPAHHTENLFLTYESAKAGWTVSAFVRNLANNTIKAYGIISSTQLTGAPLLGTLEPPRTFGAEVRYKF